MEEKAGAPLDAAALRALLDEREGELTGILLRLAWEAGLKRAEILSLKWEQVDFERRRLRLSDRIVPLSASAAAALERWRERLPETEYVASSPRTGKPVAGSSASAAAREALDAAGLTGARLEDLRADYIRRAAAARGDGFALRVSGSRRLLAASAAPEKPPVAEETTAADVRERLWSVMQANRRGAAAVALWLSEQAGVRGRELTELTWERVDLERGVLHLERGDVMLIQELIDVLRREKESRGEGDDPHVIRLPSTGRGVTSGQLSALLRELLMKNGLEHLRLGALRREEQAERDCEAIRRLVRRSGSVTRRQAAELLGIPQSTAAERLRALVASGELVQTPRGCVGAERGVPRERWEDAVARRAENMGYVTAAEVEELLHVGRKSARTLLRRMEERGLLRANGNRKRYFPAGYTP